MADPVMIPESDLIAVKESHTKELGELAVTHKSDIETMKGEHGTAIEELSSKATTANEELSRLRAANTQLEEAGRNHASSTEELGKLKGELKEAQKSSKGAQDSLVATYRDQLMAEPFSIPEKALEGKSIDQLQTIREALLATRSPNSSNYTAGGGGGDTQKVKPRDMIKKGLEAGELTRQ